MGNFFDTINEDMSNYAAISFPSIIDEFVIWARPKLAPTGTGTAIPEIDSEALQEMFSQYCSPDTDFIELENLLVLVENMGYCRNSRYPIIFGNFDKS